MGVQGLAQAETAYQNALDYAKERLQSCSLLGAKATLVRHIETRTGPDGAGQRKLIRAAFEAGVKPSVIARQFCISPKQVERIIGSSNSS